MSLQPFKDAEISDAKALFAEAYQKERLRNPFAPDPFRAALTIWNEDNGQLPRALWVAHAAKWHTDADVLSIVEELQSEVVEETLQEKLALIRDKVALKEHILLKLVSTLDLAFDPKEVREISNEIAKYSALHETPNDDDNAGKVLGVIHHRLEPMDTEAFKVYARNQQSGLQGDLIELAASDVSATH